MGGTFSKHKFKPHGDSLESWENDGGVRDEKCSSSSRYKGLSTPRILEDSSSRPCLKTKVDPPRPNAPGSSHPPPTSSRSSTTNNNNHHEGSRQRAQRTESYDHLQLGSLTETWRNCHQWEKFKSYLRTLNEGIDSDGKPLSLERYAIFIELYSSLDSAERHKKLKPEALKQIIKDIRCHPLDFYGRERCLKCIDAGMRSAILRDVKRVLSNELEPGLWVYQPAYYRVLDKLNDLVGAFHDPKSIRS
ncbi:unnamed protein product [Lepeophtheirus salmonis]|uniref:(salmon louse) hypothetical protein n=1 Tax=Lepeophtheirus salmonis TaxID=72036 RepID=A0A0K2V5U1_LEPSM|nr:unnamed protein product [Lepeophtheirus salmonis]CAF2974304.1 unnamed protein product [Lepeophtheirus salmonis]